MPYLDLFGMRWTRRLPVLSGRKREVGWRNVIVRNRKRLGANGQSLRSSSRLMQPEFPKHVIKTSHDQSISMSWLCATSD